MSDPFLDDMAEFEQAINDPGRPSVPIEQPTPTFGVVGFDCSIRRDTETDERVVILNCLTHEGAVHSLLLTPSEAHEVGTALFVSGWEADGNYEAAEAFQAAFDADPNTEYNG